MSQQLTRVAVLGRGAAAVRFLHVARELALEDGRPLATVAVVEDADRGGLVARSADALVVVPPGVLPHDGAAVVDLRRLDRALGDARADAVWLGDPTMPGAAALRTACHALDVPVVASTLRLPDDDGGVALARLADDLHIARGDDARGRRIDALVVADADGTTVVAGLCDVSCSTPDGVLLAASPPVRLEREAAEAMCEAARRLARAAGLHGVAAVGFAVGPDGPPRLAGVRLGVRDVDVAVDLAGDLDLAKLELAVHRGMRLGAEPPAAHGHAVAVRITADVGAGARVIRLCTPHGAGIRVDVGVDRGETVPSADATCAVVAAHGRERGEALARLRCALAATDLVVAGGTTTRLLAEALLAEARVRAGDVDVGWFAAWRRGGPAPTPRFAREAVLLAATLAYDAERAVARAHFRATAARGRPEAPAEPGHRIELRLGTQPLALHVLRLRPRRYRVVAGEDVACELDVEARDEEERLLTIGGQRLRALAVAEGAGWRIEIGGESHRVTRADGGIVRAPAPAVVAGVHVTEGATVRAGDPLVTLEAMKMEMPVVAPFAGRVRRVCITPNIQVSPGTALVVLEPPAEAGAGSEPPSAFDLRGVPPPPAETDAPVLLLRGLLLGYDVDPSEVRDAVAADPVADPARIAAEHELLETFADVWAVFGGRPPADDQSAESWPGEEWLLTWLRAPDARSRGLPATFVATLRRALAHYAVDGLTPSPALDEALMLLWQARHRLGAQVAAVTQLLGRRMPAAAEVAGEPSPRLRAVLDRLALAPGDRHPGLAELVRQLHFRLFEEPRFARLRRETVVQALAKLDALARGHDGADADDLVQALVECPMPLTSVLGGQFAAADPARRALMLEMLLRRYYRLRSLERVDASVVRQRSVVGAEYRYEGRRVHVLSTWAPAAEVADAARTLAALTDRVPAGDDVVLDFYLTAQEAPADVDATAAELAGMLSGVSFARTPRRISVACTAHDSSGVPTRHFTFRPAPGGFVEERLWRGLHRMMAKRLELWRLAHFDIDRLPSEEDVFLFRGVAHTNPKDERLFAVVEIRDLSVVRDADGRLLEIPHLDRVVTAGLAAMRDALAGRPQRERPVWNRLFLYCWPPLTLSTEEMRAVVERHGPAAESVGLEKVVVRARMPDPATGALREQVIHVTNPGGRRFVVAYRPPADEPIHPLTAYQQKVVQLRQRGLVHPFEIVRLIAPPADGRRGEFPAGDFVEHDLDGDGELVPVRRGYGENTANIVVGVIRNATAKHPEGMTRVILLGDPSRSMGALAEPECRRIIAALDLAERLHVPLEWFALSAGAKISMDSGTENMDWISRVLRRIVTFTQANGELNVVVVGINVGAQPYWNAEATMLMHTRGILVMTPEAAMVLTGKQALDYSGSVSADDQFGIGGYDRVMGPNGQSQYRARSLSDACHILFRHYDHTYVAPGERWPRRALSHDPIDRDVCDAPHGGEFATVGDVFSEAANPGRKRPFDVRRVMQATIDHDHPPLERWAGMRDAEVAVVWDAHLGGWPVCLLGLESHPLPRSGYVPADGPAVFTAGTLFPASSKKVARALNAASGNRPVVVLANLSGFDGSPESMRQLQLEYGAEIGRAVVNFRGPIVFAVISRYHGGAFVVFSRTLQEQFVAVALEGTYASVIGGAPAAAVVFAGEVDKRTRADERVAALQAELAQATGATRAMARARLESVTALVRSQKLGQVADEFDHVHTVQRALSTGSLDAIIPPSHLRPFLIEAIERGMRGAISMPLHEMAVGGAP